MPFYTPPYRTPDVTSATAQSLADPALIGQLVVTKGRYLGFDDDRGAERVEDATGTYEIASKPWDRITWTELTAWCSSATSADPA